MRSIALSVLVSLLAFISCKKDSKPPTPDTDPELLGPETNKIIHYSFNGSLSDGSGNNLNATNSANDLTYTTDRFGRANQAAVFPGTSGPVLVLTPSLDTRVTGFPFSVSVWFKTSSVSNSQILMRSDGGEGGSYSGYWLQIGVAGEGTMSFSFGDNTGNSSSSRNTITTPPVFAVNTWNHVVINVRGANDMDFYINGVKNNSCSYSGDATTMAYHPTYHGGAIGLYPGASSIFEGVMDDYRIYTKVLSQTEVSSLYNFQP
ncbi:MAG TPA: LamG domain-containing protein [Chitinophagaceae bacterium]|nr:LamG domain-containing protein [Chitinophagaceae bacterium]